MTEPSEAAPRIIRQPENCWRASRAEKARFLVDGASYFEMLETVLPAARSRIWIIGWDFDPDIRLRPDVEGSPKLGELLRSLVDANDELEVRILVWDMGPLYSAQSVDIFLHHEWAEHPRIFLRFDKRHPLRGAHHQKIVSIDGSLAFIGGIDLTAERWDDRSHAESSPHRVTPKGEAYGPVHDLQTMLSGPAARDVTAVAEDRWHRAMKEQPPVLDANAAPWPDGVEPSIADCPTGIARTIPGFLGRKRRTEAFRLTHDALAAARDTIYIETQYLASFRIGRTLGRMLEKRDGPEVLILATEATHGVIEKFVMGANRDRLIRRLQRSDRYGRLRVMHAVVPGGEDGELPILIHAKLVIVDDRFVRIGSSNLANRSEGLDTECDVALEAEAEAHRAAIAGLRNSLLAEHLDSTEEKVAEAMVETGSILKAVEQLNVKPRGLRDFDADTGSGTTPLPGTGMLDPRKPYWPLQRLFRPITRLFGGPDTSL